MSGAAREVQLGARSLTLPSEELGLLEPSPLPLHDYSGLRRELQHKGYLFLRNFHPREAVLEAERSVLRWVAGQGDAILDPAHPVEEGVLNHRCGKGCVPFMEGHNDITHHPAVSRVIAGDHVKKFFTGLFGSEAVTFDYKWLRAMYQEGFTGAHVDWVYMGRGTPQLMTLWTPIGDTPIEKGVLAVCEGSHRLESFKKFQETYGHFDIEEQNLDGTGWFTNDPLQVSQQFGGRWRTCDFRAGDALIFTMQTVHMSTVNRTRLARISCDTRWQAANEKMDPRYAAEAGQADPKFGVYGDASKDDSGKRVTMEEMKKMWGFC